jgi:two-component system, OmpR family, sensor kinase
MRAAWSRVGLRGRLALSIGAIVLSAVAVIFTTVRGELADERATIKREEQREAAARPASRVGGDPGEPSPLAPVSDAQREVVKTLVIAGGLTLMAALLAGYLLAARTAAPMRRMAAIASAVDAGDLTPRIGREDSAAVEVRTLADSFDHMLDRLDDAFSRQRQFVSDASHELRTPLTAIRGQLEVLGRGDRPDDAELRRVERVALAEMARVERLIDDLLALAQLDETTGLAREDVNPRRYLRRLVEEGALECEIALEDVPEGSVPADPDRLTQVIRNLLGNARRHAGTDGRVVLSAEAEGSRLRFRIDDDGPGVAPPERELVFDRFHRSEGSRARATGGSGLGLAIARSIVERHGGRIWVEDSPLGGARVVFELAGFKPQLGNA